MMDLFTSDPNTLFYLMMTVAVLAIGGVVVVLGQAFKRTPSDVVSERIQGIGFGGRAKRRKVDDQLEKAMSSLSRLTAPSEQQKITGLRKGLSYAGYRSSKAPMFFFGLKATGALLFGGLGVAYSIANAENLLHVLITVGAYLLSAGRTVSMILITPGPKMMMKVAGRMKSTSGSVNLTAILAAFSSAAWRLLVRIVSAKTLSAWAMEVPSLSDWIRTVARLRRSSRLLRSARFVRAFS